MNIFKRLYIALTYGPELDSIVKEIKDKKEAEIRRSRMKILSLCYDHRQERHHSHYSSHNCDYCKIEARLKVAEQALQDKTEEVEK